MIVEKPNVFLLLRDKCYWIWQQKIDSIWIVSCSWSNHTTLLLMFVAEKVLLLLVISLTVKGLCRYPILLHWRKWSAGTPGMLCDHMHIAGTPFSSSTLKSAVERTLPFGTLLYGEDTDTWDMSCCYGLSTPFLNQWHSWWSMHSMKPSRTLWTMG